MHYAHLSYINIHIYECDLQINYYGRKQISHFPIYNNILLSIKKNESKQIYTHLQCIFQHLRNYSSARIKFSIVVLLYVRTNCLLQIAHKRYVLCGGLYIVIKNRISLLCSLVCVSNENLHSKHKISFL